MTNLHQRALRVLIAMQVAVIEHADEDLLEDKVVEALIECNKQWQKLMKEFTTHH